MRSKSTTIFIALVSAILTSAATAAELSVLPTGAPGAVYRWESMRCEQWDVPDASARAWRDVQGQVHLIASHLNSRAMLGADLDHVKQDCRIVFKGDELPQPERYDDRSWLASTYTLDGRRVFALIHNEFHGHLRPALCPSQEYIRCWSNTLTFATSNNGGSTFGHATPPWQFAAGLPYPYPGDVGHRRGYFNPSNIVRRGEFFYVFFWAEAERAQRRGACLMRTADLADRRAWRAWDGHDFTIRFADPYVEDVHDDTKHVCTPVGEGGLTSFVSSVTLHRPSGLYLALMATSRAPAAGESPVSGIFSSTSSDLIHWSDPKLVLKAGVIFKYECTDRDIVFYPSLLDPQSPSRNFEDAGDQAYIYFTDIHLDACRIGTNRDLMRIPVEIQIHRDLGDAVPPPK